MQRERLLAPQVDLAAPGETDLDVGEREAEQRQDAQAAVRGEVPGAAERGALNGMRKLTGTESGSSSRSAKARSTMSALVSPMPKIAPEHGDSPAATALLSVSTRSANVWVEQMSA